MHTLRLQYRKTDLEKEKSILEIKEGMSLVVQETKVTEHFNSAPKHYTEDTLLSAMERAGNEDMNDDVERKGLGTPATRADIIEKLVKDGYIRREKKHLFPTEQGEKLIHILPDIVKSPKLTADWENKLTLVAKGELSDIVFMGGIDAMIRSLIEDNKEAKEEYKALFPPKAATLGKCPKCGSQVLKGKFGAYCSKKCGMNVSVYFGKPYDMYLQPQGIEEYTYEKNGQTIHGYQFIYEKSFPKNTYGKKNKRNGRKEG